MRDIWLQSERLALLKKKVWKVSLRLLNRFTAKGQSLRVAQLDESFAEYEDRLPTSQNAVDAIPGWTSAFPPESGVRGGSTPLFVDGRITDALAAYGSIEGKRVLEVGPLEGMHTYILNQKRPARIDAIEANKSCYFRCLVTKEILKIDKAAFHLGDIKEWLTTYDQRYDFGLASGVLYHMPDPGEFLRLLALRVDAVFIWTHYFNEEEMPRADVRRVPFSGRVEVRDVAGMEMRYFERSYQSAQENASFCGGMKDRHYWLEKKEIIELLRHIGYNSVTIQAEDPTHPGGPCFSVLARRV